MTTPAKPFDWSSIKNLIVRNGWCHARVQMGGKEHWRSLHIEADPEGRNSADVREALRAFKLALAKDTHAILRLTRSRDEASTFTEIYATYRAACAGRAEIKPETVEVNIRWMENILRTCGHDPETCRASALTPTLLELYQERVVTQLREQAAKEGWSEETLRTRMQSRQNSIKSAIGQARSLFAHELRQSHHYKALTLPDLHAFLDFRVAGRRARVFRPMDHALWQQILAGIRDLATADRPRWFALQLSLNCGLRRGSARNARWDWCREQPDGSAIMDVLVAKESTYQLTIEADLWSEWKAARGVVPFPDPKSTAADAYIIHGATEKDRDGVIQSVVYWLRSHGVNEQKPFHYMRKYHGDAMDRTHGLEEAARRLGHKNSNITKSHYVDGRSTKAVRVV